MASLVVKGKADNGMIKDRKMREPNCSTFFFFFNEGKFELPGARKGLQITETEMTEEEEEKNDNWQKARELDFAKQG